MTFSVADTLDQHILRTERPRPPDGLWHPSSLFSCMRQAIYEVRGVPASDPRTDKSRRILKMGSTVHEIVQEALTADSGAEAVYNEVEVNIPPLRVTGHCDTLLRHADDDYELLEFKSISPRGMQYGDLPKSEHVRQARTYVYGLRRFGGTVVLTGEDLSPLTANTLTIPPLGSKLREPRLAYFSRDDLRVEEFVLDPDPEWDQRFEDYIARLEKYREDGTALPLRLPLEKGRRNWLCKDYCQFRSRCWDNDPEGEVL